MRQLGRVLDQAFVHRVVVSVCCLELSTPCCTPGDVFVGGTPVEDGLNCFPSRNLRCDLGRHHYLPVCSQLPIEVNSLHDRLHPSHRPMARKWHQKPS